ncbi:uncharacterized protein LOC132316252 [Cornus florida]|uniref:uncharacterized protein LOC132316252 n=1 Tax=Cornus florida TaxID=4283 RepID=UPI002896ECF4|nr:uncharacterized protein LOC132316252 [Cornus florida]
MATQLGYGEGVGWDESDPIAPVSSLYGPNDELISLNGSDDEVLDSDSTYQEYIPSRDLGENELEIGMKFGSAEDFRLALRETALRGKFDIKFTKNDGDKFHSNAQASSSFIANKYLEQLRLNPKMPFSTLKSTIASDLDIDVSKHKVYRAKRKALEMIEGNEEEQYEKMRDYCSLISRINPGSIVKLQTEPTGVENKRRFMRVFIRYDVMKIGFKEGFRLLIGVDCCFLKGPYGGYLLSTVANDGNGQMFTVAIAVVESETRDSWEWFMGELMDAIGPYQDITFISDR